ncbi:hypothetical protein PF005_g22761 [Phytophthora fragariae]|uniref:Uncharacterized protein n=1 Tax=Phytophthora fragariae TaxID=53985 RepID=A0A6A3QRZ0_9STRA|nr:hypothetical protein PF003_g8991 [Phytophthora fragariae]KAE8925615.1 hypothetical protein PF009_g24177 [Phytophthora fragariae]KAE8981978.1 hypothetical protein PF011_g21812 [Phytophthora fragariae]KAE9081667.1 hypothetical protein PF007_g22570 [Phytophthora fragariae]KAE9100061.1 hypothetical protein PF006_g22991 [Phytophthora fragariae]
MDLSEIPFDVPVILQSARNRKNLQNPLGSKHARCLENNRDIYEQLILRRVRDDKVAIQCVRNGRFLQCGDFNVVKCKNQNRQYYEEWRIVEPRATAVVSPLMHAQRQVMVHEERKKFVLELARCGMAAGEIESIVTRLFDMSVAIPEPNKGNKGPVYAKRLDEKSVLA